MLPTPAAAASCTAAVAHAGTDATHRGSNRRKSTRLRSRPQQRSCSSVGSVGAGGPAGTDRDAADACRSGIMHRGSRTCRYRCNSPWQQPAQEHPAAQPAATTQLQLSGQCGRLGPSRTDRDAADACRSGIMHRGSRTCRYRCNSPCSNRRKSTRLRSRPQQRSCSSVGSVGAGGPAGTDRDAADACRSGIMHRGSRTCRYRCNSPWQQPAQEHPAAQPAQQRSAAQWAVWAPAAQQGPTVMLPTPAAAASCTAAVAHDGTDATHRASNRRKSTPAAQPVATTQLQLSGQCGRRRPSRDRP